VILQIMHDGDEDRVERVYPTQNDELDDLARELKEVNIALPERDLSGVRECPLGPKHYILVDVLNPNQFRVGFYRNGEGETEGAPSMVFATAERLGEFIRLLYCAEA
jgi:hypothetical protein